MRESGYYWVILNGFHEVAYYSNNNWQVAGSESIYEDSDFSHIYEERIKEPD